MRKFFVACAFATLASVSTLLAQTPIKIPFWYSVGGAVKQTIETRIKEYNSSQSKYQIEGVFAGSYEESVQKVIAAVVAGDAPVLIHQAHVYAPQLVDAGAFEALDAYIAKDKTFQRDQFIESLFQANVYKGKTWGIAFNCSTPIMFYNKDMFRKAGLDPEKFPDTWQGVYEASKKIAKLGPDTYGLTLDYGSGWILEALVWQFGAEWLAKDNSKVLWTEPAHIEAVKFFKRMIDEKVAVYKGADAALLSQKAAIAMNSTVNLSKWGKSATFNLGTAPFPSATKKSVPVGGGSLYMFKRNPQKVKDGAWDFIKFMTTKENQSKWAEATGYFTARKDSKLDLDKGLLLKDKRYNTTYLQLGYIRPENETWYPQFLNIRTIYNEAWDKIMLQNSDVKATLEEASAKASAVIKENS
ncbi:MAG: ABC transporter substrate-binding protein [Treponemataceae bacterium]